MKIESSVHHYVNPLKVCAAIAKLTRKHTNCKSIEKLIITIEAVSYSSIHIFTGIYNLTTPYWAEHWRNRKEHNRGLSPNGLR